MINVQDVGEKLLCTDKNPISVALTLTGLTDQERGESTLPSHGPTRLGSMLFIR